MISVGAGLGSNGTEEFHHNDTLPRYAFIIRIKKAASIFTLIDILNLQAYLLSHLRVAFPLAKSPTFVSLSLFFILGFCNFQFSPGRLIAMKRPQANFSIR
jgi:hypothetical protein